MANNILHSAEDLNRKNKSEIRWQLTLLLNYLDEDDMSFVLNLAYHFAQRYPEYQNDIAKRLQKE